MATMPNRSKIEAVPATRADRGAMGVVIPLADTLVGEGMEDDGIESCNQDQQHLDLEGPIAVHLSRLGREHQHAGHGLGDEAKPCPG
jgi:hypothetical protein